MEVATGGAPEAALDELLEPLAPSAWPLVAGDGGRVENWVSGSTRARLAGGGETGSETAAMFETTFAGQECKSVVRCRCLYVLDLVQAATRPSVSC